MAGGYPIVSTVLDAIHSLLSSQAVATGTVGNPANQVISVTEANERLLLDQVSSSSIGTMYSATLPTNGTPYTVVSVDIIEIGVGASVQIQGRNDDLSAWTTIQMSSANNNNASNSMGGVGLTYAYFPFAQIRLYQGAISSGTTKARLMLLKGSPMPKRVSVSGASVGFQKPGDAVVQGVRARSSLPAITSQDFVIEAQGTLDGVTVNKPYAIPQMDWAYPAPSGGLTTTVAATAVTASGAGIRNYITSMQLSNDSATATELLIRDAASSAVLWRDKLPANMPPTTFTFPCPLKGTANSALEVVAGSGGAAVYVNLQGYKSGAMA